jgi:2-deoxystreptamine N-acetyl-D-glucosaminyltransferase/2-deoxystreptamine glucosyltransferase
VLFSGWVPRETMPDLYRAADVLVLPSQYEGLSHTLLEACAAGVPCIASDRGGNPEIVEHERSGLLVPYGEPAALRAALERLQADEDLRYALACGAKARSAAFDFDRTVAGTIDLLVKA